MMVLGLEEPLKKNKQIYALNESTNEVELSRVEDDGLNRYSFVWIGGFAQRDRRMAELLRHLHAHLGLDPCWFLIWETPRVDNKPLDDPKIPQRQNEGWEVHAGETITVGQRLLEWETLEGPKPPEFERRVGDGGLFLVFGDTPPAPDYTLPPMKKTMEDFANKRELSPSSPVLSWFRERRLTLVYPLRDLHSRLGLVVVSPTPLDVSALKQDGFAATVHENDEASLAWRYADA